MFPLFSPRSWLLSLKSNFCKTYLLTAAAMELRLKNLTIAFITTISLSGGLRAQEIKSEVGLLTHSLEIRDSEQLPACIYTSSGTPSRGDSGSVSGSVSQNQYNVWMNLPGEGWRRVCLREEIMFDMLEYLTSKCEKEWQTKGLPRRFHGAPSLTLEKNHCRIKLTVHVDAEYDPAFPRFEEPCIWGDKPDFSSCVDDPTWFPWPSKCTSHAVSLCLGSIGVS